VEDIEGVIRDRTSQKYIQFNGQLKKTKNKSKSLNTRRKSQD